MSTLYLGKLAHLCDDPFSVDGALEIVEQGALWVSDEGHILASGERKAVIDRVGIAKTVDFGESWMLPGLIDGHCHFPQHFATASYGRDLLDWLNCSVFPAEQRYADPDYATEAAKSFVQRLLACGTTTALVFGSQFLEANLALFDAAKEAGLRLIAGMTLMDVGAPAPLLKPVSEASQQVERLIAHIRDEPLLHYAVTPRFALSCSEELMAYCGDAIRRYPLAYLQTHINESKGEIAAVKAAFPGDCDYLGIYQRHGLIGPRSMLAHNIHVDDRQLARMAEADCAICHCPTSNLYLGSGLFSLKRHAAHGIRVAIGSDIGAGTHHSVWNELAEAYKVQQLHGYGLSSAKLLYLGTLGGAKALRLDTETGNFVTGKSADFWVLSPQVNPYLQRRLSHCESLEEQLFCLLNLASAYDVQTTYVAGKCRYR